MKIQYKISFEGDKKMVKRLILKCPVCGASKMQKIPESLINKRNCNEKGICTILIPEDSICEHLFVVYVDRDFRIRGADTPDEIKEFNPKSYVNIHEIKDLVAKLKPASIKSLLKNL